MDIIFNVFFFMFVCMSAVWTFFAWGMGLCNFKIKYGDKLGAVGDNCWYLLFLCHFFVLYQVWFKSVSIGSMVLLLFLFHVIFGAVFGRNVSAA